MLTDLFVYPITMLIIYLASLILSFTSNRVDKKILRKMTADNFVLKFSIIIPIISALVSLIFVIIIVLKFISDGTLPVGGAIFLGFVMLVGLLCSFMSLREKIIVEGDKITYFPPFAKKRIFTFDDITSVKIYMRVNAKYIVCYKNDKKIFTINPAFKGYKFFLYRLKERHIIDSNI